MSVSVSVSSSAPAHVRSTSILCLGAGICVPLDCIRLACRLQLCKRLFARAAVCGSRHEVCGQEFHEMLDCCALTSVPFSALCRQGTRRLARAHWVPLICSFKHSLKSACPIHGGQQYWPCDSRAFCLANIQGTCIALLYTRCHGLQAPLRQQGLVATALGRCSAHGRQGAALLQVSPGGARRQHRACCNEHGSVLQRNASGSEGNAVRQTRKSSRIALDAIWSSNCHQFVSNSLRTDTVYGSNDRAKSSSSCLLHACCRGPPCFLGGWHARTVEYQQLPV